jgi:hypothetical protein
MIDENQLYGPLPAELGLMTAVEELDLSKYSEHRNTLLPIISFLTTNCVISIGDNLLTGKIPTEIGNLPAINELNLGKSGLADANSFGT